jgi:hypothetical protein
MRDPLKRGPEGETHEEQIARRVQRLVIRANVEANARIMPRIPGVEKLAEDLKPLIELQHHETRLALIMEILNAQSAEQALGMLLASLAVKESQKVADWKAWLTGESEGEAPGSELQQEGGEDNSSFYPPKK